ncbi:MAG TPA: hypothetical protein VM077_03285 [Candidatus Limnocylindrales bacterium]|nr:hypothetical protein [Candidatus Limnocylindrales bacterium]
MDKLRICTWNIKRGQYLPILLNEFATQKVFSGLDIVGIQEAFIHDEIEDAQQIAKRLGPEYKFFQHNIQIKHNLSQGNAFIWNSKKIKIKKTESFLLPDVYGKHLPYLEKMFFKLIPKQDRCCIVAEGQYGKKSIRIYVTHLDVLGYSHKRAQLKAIFTHSADQKPVDLTCIIGDFNTYKIVTRPKWKNLSKDALDAGFQDLTTEIVWTFSRPRVKFKQKLDSIFIKPFNYAYESRSQDIKGSDHIPVFCDINLDKSNP